MANVYAVQNGNWSDGSTWSSGSVPTADDDVYANGHTVNLNVNIISCKRLSNQAYDNTISGGSFVRTISQSITINADCYGNGGTLLTLKIDCIGWTINGNCYQEDTSVPLIIGGHCVYTNNDFIINGNCYGYTLMAILYTHWSNSYASITINGNYTGFINIAEESGGDPYETLGPIIFNGNVSFYSATNSILLTSTGKVYFYGTLADNGVRIQAGLLSLHKDTTFENFPRVCGIITNGYNVQIIKSQDGLSLTSLYDRALPQETQVAQGVTYGMQNEYEGRLALPQPSTVLKDVEYGNKVGTLEVIALSGATAQADQIAVVNLTEQEVNRVKNCATIQTVQQCFEDFKDE